MCIHRLYLSMTTLMHSKGSKCHLTLNTFMSIAEHIRHLKVISVLYSFGSQAIISDKKFDILGWKKEMYIFSLVGQPKCCNIENFFLSKYVRLSMYDNTFMHLVCRPFVDLQSECTISN